MLQGSSRQVNAALERQDRRLILAFDEFEQFDIKIGDGIVQPGSALDDPRIDARCTGD